MTNMFFTASACVCVIGRRDWLISFQRTLQFYCSGLPELSFHDKMPHKTFHFNISDSTPRHELQGAAGVCARGARAGGGLQADQLLQAEGVRLQGPAGSLEEAACGAAGARPRARARRSRRHAAAGGHRHGRERDADPGHGGHRPRADHGLLLPAGGRSVHAGHELETGDRRNELT